MNLPLIVIRPEPGCAETVAAARALGLEALGFPLFLVGPLAWTPPPPDSIDALLIGSANAIRHAGPALAAYRGMPCYAVGARTARAAREAGLAVVATGNGGLAKLLDGLAPGHRRLLRLAGAERIALTMPADVAMTERVVYASQPVPMSGTLALLLHTHALPGVVVALHSAEAARHFSAECARLELPRHRLRIAALGPRIAGALPLKGWDTVAAAQAPDDNALLALAARMCQ